MCGRYHLPLLWRAINWVTLMGWKLRGGGEAGHTTPQYIKDFKLLEWTHQALFYEYLEMVIQVIVYNNTIIELITFVLIVWVHHHLRLCISPR